MSTFGHGDRKYLQSRVLLSSVGRGWSGIAADLRAHAVCEVPPFDPVRTEVPIAIRGCSGLVLRTGGGERQETRSGAGKIWLSPAGVHMEDICITAPHVIHRAASRRGHHGCAAGWCRLPQSVPLCPDVQGGHGCCAASLCQPTAAGEADGVACSRQAVLDRHCLRFPILLASQLQSRIPPGNGRHAGRVPTGRPVAEKSACRNLRRRGQNYGRRGKDARRLQSNIAIRKQPDTWTLISIER
jgi:hypothetical protein